MVNEIKISQSLIKAYNDYLNGKICGLLFEKQYILKEIESEPTDSMRLGHYFEFKATGALPRNGIEPIPERTQKGELTAAYKVAEKQAANFKKYCKALGIEIISYGKRIEKDNSEGLIDIEASIKGERVIIDLKFSGLMDDKWNELGWNLEALPYKEKIMIQAVHYSYLTEIPFYFWVFSSKNEDENKLIKVNIDPDVLKVHPSKIEDIRGLLEIDLDLGFKAYPELLRCKYCPLFSSCRSKTEIPTIEEVYYTNQ